MNIIGHKKIVAFFDKAVAKKAISHAYIFSGPDQVGKFALAQELAKKILTQVSIGDNLIIVQPEIERDEKKGSIKKKDITIDQIRGLQHSLSLTAGGSEHRIAIIDEADRMNNKAQNAFLKTLEEAPDGVVLILIVRDEKNILATISSRCQKIRFGIVADSELQENIPSAVKNKQELIFWSMGCPGLLMNFLADDKSLDFYTGALSELKGLFFQSVSERFIVAEAMAKNIEVAVRKLNLWTLILRNIILGKSLDFKLDSVRALRLIEKIENEIKLLNKNNFNARLILENLFLNL